MSKVLFLNVHGHGHINPTLGLVEELIKNGEEVTYFAYEEFREKIEKTGATFRGFKNEVFKRNPSNDIRKGANIEKMLNFSKDVLESSEAFIEDFLNQIEGENFDYMVYGSSFPYGNIIAKILKIPSVSSFAIFATLKEIKYGNIGSLNNDIIANHPVNDTYRNLSANLKKKYDIEIPHFLDLFFNQGDINIAYTSRYFVAHPEYYNDSFIFIGPPKYESKENIDFPFEKLKDKTVLYISLGTVFSNYNLKFYDLFFEAFANMDLVVVMTAYKVDTSQFNIPENFIVKNYVPQAEILKYTDIAITHSGMNSTNDLLYNNIPFVAIPMGADQPYMASRSEELGAAITLDKDNLTVEDLRASVHKVLNDPSYKENINKISASYRECGGYKKAVEEIFKLKEEKGLIEIPVLS